MPKLISATEFKATCLDILDRISAGEWDRVEVTKRGRVVAVLVPPTPPSAAIAGLHGFMRDSVIIPAGLDLTAPIADEAFAAAEGTLHG
ncbi:type II toxin-antitoxin system Phd/YefM family antitoxin [Falsiroseomonas sp.]|uniref:type II toxin-antitoxin system Phd/YefM family antitoxin n=1 Tax=Falsiroseomonas sp. TaxID=2870721 RepID=UPI00271FDBA5|nr:type II toxin-antitoxin system prevent-host-death family antitoxin [Falsiroseomonas sp.]MDO9503104.1 type II toxin-antitoxin system prevent-host-death family antitoxin [Falsiroseomonas sp.]MDP3416943.1 type II toxin-antitoxin system prevent-host-death family antitoxin [Falsiroseomonas sp.]